jgi:Protein of unknown function (DUF2442)
MRFVKAAQYEQEYVLQLTFDDQVVKRVNLKAYLEGPIFEPLKNVNYFKCFRLHPELETIVWENDADFSPDFLYEIGETLALEQTG